MRWQNLHYNPKGQGIHEPNQRNSGVPIMKYEVWVSGKKSTTKQILEVPAYRDGSAPTMLKIKGIACRSIFFDWSDYKQIKYKKIPLKTAREKALN